MLRFTKNLKSTRLGVKRRAETDESSLARTKFANGPLFVWSSPNQQNKHWLVDENEKKYDGLESRYIEGKVGHQEVPIKDWLMPKPTRWQVEWSKYMTRKTEIESAAGYKVTSSRCKQINWDWEQETNCFLSRIGLPANLLTAEELQQILLKKSEQNRYFSENVLPVGAEFTSWYLNTFLSEIMPKLPEEGRAAIIKTLTGEKYLEYQLRHTGILDFGVDNKELEVVDVLNGLLGKLLFLDHENSGNSETETKAAQNGQIYAVKLLQTIVLSGSIQRDVLRDLWKISPTRAVELLNEVESGFQSRLVSQSSSTDIIRSFEVGIFDKNQVFLGSSFGESISQAECDAAIVALAEVYEIGEEGFSKFMI